MRNNIILASITVLLVLAGCTEARPGADGPGVSPEPSATATLIPVPTATAVPVPTPFPAPEVTFRFSKVPAGDEALIRGGVDIAVRYLVEATGIGAPSVTVYASGDIGDLVEVYASTPAGRSLAGLDFGRRVAYGLAEANIGSIFVYTGAPLWQSSNAVQRIRAVVHEYVHVFQFELMGEGLAQQRLITPAAEMPPWGPMWLFEGSADLTSWRAMEAAGLTSVDAQVGLQKAQLPASGLSLAEMETYLGYLGGGTDSIGMALIAAELLLGGEGEPPMVAYFQALASGRRWQEAFSPAFRQTSEQFYANFARYQASGFKAP